jgi:hypothetical protein
MEKQADCGTCGGKVALGRCLNCGEFRPRQRWLIFPVAIVALLALAAALKGEGSQPLALLTDLLGAVR